MFKLFDSDDDDLGYLDDTVHINWKKFLPAIIIAVVAVIALIIVLIVSFGHKGKKTLSNVSSTEETSSVNGTDADGNNTLSDKDEKELDPQYSDTDGSMNQSAGNGASVVLSNSTNETSDITIGIDVSKFQGTIDWAQVASSGVDFAMIRVGYRAQKTGVIYADTNAKYNMQQAAANGIKVGAYFFSSAVNEAEAIEEADWVADFISDYSTTGAATGAGAGASACFFAFLPPLPRFAVAFSISLIRPISSTRPKKTVSMPMSVTIKPKPRLLPRLLKKAAKSIFHTILSSITAAGCRASSGDWIRAWRRASPAPQ